MISHDNFVYFLSYSFRDGLVCAHSSLFFKFLILLLISSTRLQAFSVLFKIVHSAYSHTLDTHDLFVEWIDEC